jgi:secretion/DNA translocation related CpaE-like protein
MSEVAVPLGAPSRGPLAVTADPQLVDDLVRVAADAGVELVVTSDLEAVGRPGTAGPLVVVGADVVERVGSRLALLTDESAVVVVTRDGDDRRIWEFAASLRAAAVLVLPLAERLLAERLVAATDSAAQAPAVAVVAGCGGAGASTLVAAMGVTAARRGLRPLVVDADPWGGGLDLLLGAEGRAGLRWPALVDARGGLGAVELRSALPQVDGVTVLSWDRGPHLELPVTAAEAVTAAGRRAHDLVVVDVSGRPDPVGSALVRSAELVLLVATAEVRAAAAAARVAGALPAGDVRLVVRRVRATARGGRLPAAELADAVGRPLAGELVSEPSVRAAAEQGEPPARTGRGALARLCAALLDELGPLPRAA